MDKPLISIITPSYNQGEFLEDTILSVKNQTYPNVEHIIVDGGSEDDTVDILREYDSEYQLTWVSEPDDGQSDAINKGFEQASGDIVAWINSDDVYFDTHVFTRVAQYFRRYSADIIYGDLVHIDKDSTVQAVDPHPAFDRSKLFYRILIGQPATFFRGTVVKENKLRTDLHYCMDYEYWLRLSRKYKFRHVPDILSGFRVYPDQKSQNNKSMSKEFNKMIDQFSRPSEATLLDIGKNGLTEVHRWIRSVILVKRLYTDTPQMAFDGSLGTKRSLVFNIPPDIQDVVKVWHRFGVKNENDQLDG